MLRFPLNKSAILTNPSRAKHMKGIGLTVTAYQLTADLPCLPMSNRSQSKGRRAGLWEKTSLWRNVAVFILFWAWRISYCAIFSSIIFASFLGYFSIVRLLFFRLFLRLALFVVLGLVVFKSWFLYFLWIVSLSRFLLGGISVRACILWLMISRARSLVESRFHFVLSYSTSVWLLLTTVTHDECSAW